MTKPFSQYISERPAVVGALGPDDRLLVLQGGSIKRVEAQSTAVLTDINGSGQRCQVTARYDGLDDNGDPIWSLVANPL